MPKKEDGSQHGSTKGGSVKSSVNAESSTASFPSSVEQDVTSNEQESAVDNGQCIASVVLTFIHNFLFDLFMVFQLRLFV